MLIASLLRRLMRFLQPSIVDGEGGGVIDQPSPAPAPAAEAPAASPAPVEAPAAAPAGPASMLEAISRHFERDELGRFASPAEKAAAEAAQAAAGAPAAPKPAAAPAAPAAPAQAAADDDITAMPEGLGQKAQERFQRLATTNRELTQRVEQADAQVGYIRETFQQHGIQQPQFEQAVSFLGAVNRGDYQAAEQLLLGQLQQLSLLTGKTYGDAVDPLAAFPDLRQKVDNLHVSHADAIEIARLRQQQGVIQQRQQEQQQQAQQEQASQQLVRTAQADIDAWWKQTAATDIDAPAIEAQLLPHIPTLLQGVPPQSWSQVIKAQYQILKGAAGTFRQRVGSAAPAPAPLRPTGAGSQPQPQPGSMFDAMWNRPR